MTEEECELQERASEYAEARGLTIKFKERLGRGTDGWVWPTVDQSAIEVFERSRPYVCERDSYLRLRDANVTKIGIFTVPVLIDYDDELLIVEMSTVSPPYILDFGKVYFDSPPVYEDGVWEEALTEQAELFGSRWPEVEVALDFLESIGIYYVDAKPKNIDFED